LEKRRACWKENSSVTDKKHAQFLVAHQHRTAERGAKYFLVKLQKAAEIGGRIFGGKYL
ncbi:hypothetical protein T11_15219, partial [Trichinella zimbabwensis]